MNHISAEVLNTGSELLLGRILNTHQQWLCRKLSELGYMVRRQVAVADTGLDIQQALREALGRADLIVVTGGLGPTSDDLTRDYIARLLGTPLELDETVLAHIKRFFDARRRVMPETTRVQAMVPQGAIVLPNAYGTAPGLALKVAPNPFRPDGATSWVILLPGPPRELKPMFDTSVVPLLARVLPPSTVQVCRTLRSTGLGESMVEERIAGPLQPLVSTGLQIGYCARPGEVDVRLLASGNEAERLVSEAAATVRQLLVSHIFGEGDEELEEVIIRLLTNRKKTVAVAESCTGGYLAHRLTNVPGASVVFVSGLVTYSNEAKQEFLGVSAETLAANGAVSEPVAYEMAEGARRRAKADYALSVTGIAGPSGGTPAKPVGTVFIGLAGPDGTAVFRNINPFDRETFKYVTSQQALEALRQVLLGT